MFMCPGCGVELNRTTATRGIVWVCPQCKGRAVNVSLLRQLVEQRLFNRLWQTAWAEPEVSERKCPSCKQLMFEVPVNPPPDPLILDVCKPCQFVWFDPSEFEKMPAAPPPVVPPQLPQEVREAIALRKVKEMGEAHRRESNRENATADGWLSTVEFFFTLGD